MPGILIIGYGNVLREDDGVGVYAARELEKEFRNDPDVEVVVCQQLTPELADDISRSELVLFLDASSTGKLGTVQCRRVPPENGPGGFTHHLNPASLLSAAEQLYGDAPTAFAITLTGESFQMGERLSKGARLRFPELMRHAREVIESYREQTHSIGKTVRAR